MLLNTRLFRGSALSMFDNALQNVLQRFGNGFQRISVSLGNIADVLKRIENDLQCIFNV